MLIPSVVLSNKSFKCSGTTLFSLFEISFTCCTVLTGLKVAILVAGYKVLDSFDKLLSESAFYLGHILDFWRPTKMNFLDSVLLVLISTI